jgi:K+-sensing histidine kinase KdpD
MHREKLKVCPQSSAQDCNADTFYSNLATGLHAMAQPLTVLRSVATAITMPGMEAADKQRYAAISAEQVERACGIFQSLQNLLIASQNDAVCAAVDIATLLVPVVKDQKQVLRETGVRLKTSIPVGLPPVLGDMDRTLQALFAALKIAASHSERHSIVELRVNAWSDCVELSLHNESLHGKRLNAMERLSLAVAEANIRSQNGTCGYSEEPFHFSLSLPLLKKAPRNLTVLRSDDVSHGARAHSFV